ncbi:hypothetical protein A2U01_0091844, partial [Trifolium medium]|nr:hypothetical protein [Trifolium medium]
MPDFCLPDRLLFFRRSPVCEPSLSISTSSCNLDFEASTS